MITIKTKIGKVVYVLLPLLLILSVVPSSLSLTAQTIEVSPFCDIIEVGLDDDGNYIFAGSVASALMNNCTDVYVLKTNAAGNQLWDLTIGDKLNDGAIDSVRTDDGYVILGYTDTPKQGDDAWAIKINVNGSVIWQKTYGGRGLDLLNSIISTDDGGFAMCGFTESESITGHDAWLVKVDSQGTVEWTKKYGITGYNEACYVTQVADGGYVLAGRTQSRLGGLAYWLVRTDSQGIMQWNQAYGERENNIAKFVFQTSDDGFIIMGNKESLQLGNCSWVIKTDSRGIEQWNKTFAICNAQIKLTSSLRTGDGGYALAGYLVTDNSMQVWISKIDAVGNVVWEETTDVTGTICDTSMMPTPNLHYALASFILVEETSHILLLTSDHQDQSLANKLETDNIDLNNDYQNKDIFWILPVICFSIILLGLCILLYIKKVGR